MTKYRRPDDATETVTEPLSVPPRPTAVLSAGSRLGDRYVVRGVLGSGGFAVVYLADDRLGGGEVALKVLRPERVSETTLKRFRREAEVARQAASPHLVAVEDVGVADGSPYLAMERVVGESLGHRLDRGALPVEAAIALSRQLLAGLAVLHDNGILHRDVKPENVLLGDDGVARLADYGLALSALHAAETRATATEAVVGTVEYLSPEQALGEEADPRSDLYSLGVVLFEMLTGRLPHRAKSSLGTLVAHIQQPAPDVRSLRPEAPPWLAAVVARLLAKKRDDRYATAREVLADLEARRATRRRRWPGTRRQRLAAALLLATAAALGGWWLSGGGELHTVQVIDGSLTALDRDGRALWNLPGSTGTLLPARLRPGEPRRVVGFVAGEPADVYRLQIRDAANGDLVADVEMPRMADQFPGMSDTFDPSLRVLDVDRDGFDEVLVTYLHQPYWPSYTVLYEPLLGRVRPLIVASGHHRPVATADFDGDGRRDLLFAGIANRMGWHGALAAVRLTPPVNDASRGPGANAAQTPDRQQRFDPTNPLLWYALLSPRANLSPRDGTVRVDEEERRIYVARQIDDRPASDYQLDFSGFAPASDARRPGDDRNRLRFSAYWSLHEAERLLAAGLVAEAVRKLGEAERNARDLADPHLADWSARSRVTALVRAGRTREAERLAGELVGTGPKAAESAEVAEIAFDTALALFLADEPRAAAEWFSHALGSGGSETRGRARQESIEGEVFAWLEAGLPERALAAVDRFAAAYPQSGSRLHADVLRLFVHWRLGRPLDGVAAAAHQALSTGSTDLLRYLALEVELDDGEDPAELLPRVWDELDRSSETRPALVALAAHLLARLGRHDEAAAAARLAGERLAQERPTNMYARALAPVVVERCAAVLGAEAAGAAR